MVTAKQRAWRKKFAARYGKRKGASTRRVRRVKNRRPYKMARRRYGRRRRGRGKQSIPVAPLIPVGVVVFKAMQYDTLNSKLTSLSMQTTGMDPNTGTFDYNRAKGFWMGEVAAIVVHKVANKTGLNKHIRKMTMGWLSI